MFGAPRDWDPESQGVCAGLPVLDVTVEGVSYMVSRWEPSPDDLKKLNAGGAVELWISGTVHPVVGLGVTDA